MKITKKMRKKINGMNNVTERWFTRGFAPPQYANMSGNLEFPSYKKVALGVPYVNADNFMG